MGSITKDWEPLSAMEVPGYVTASAPDLIISDFQMAGCNGTSVARMAKKANPNTPVLILTAFLDVEIKANLLKMGVKKVLAKPIEAAALIQEVQDALRPVAPG